MMPRGINDRSPAARSDSIVACTIGDEQYALHGRDACEIVRAERIRRSDGSDGTVGRLYVNWETVPVYPLAVVLDRPMISSGRFLSGGNHVVVTRGPAGMVGWLVDRIARPALADRVPVIPLPSILGPPATRWFEGLVKVGDRSLLMLSPANLDPRVLPSPAASGDEGRAGSGARAPLGDDSRPPLVVLFSSPALPACRASRFALSARRIAAVIRSLPVTVVPGGARHITGVIVWRDAAVPVIDVRSEAGRALAAGDRLVIARCDATMNGALVAFAVGTEMTLHEPTRGDLLLDDGTDAGMPFVAGVFNVHGNPVALLDLDTTVSALVG